MNPTLSCRSDKGTSVRHRIAAARAIFPSASVNGWARLFAHTPFVPLSRLAGEGERAAVRPHPSLPQRGEGLGVRAKSGRTLPTANPSDVPLSALSPSPARQERGIMECGSEATAHAESNASALQTGQRAAPLSHAVGEGLGVRAKPPHSRAGRHRSTTGSTRWLGRCASQ